MAGKELKRHLSDETLKEKIQTSFDKVHAEDMLKEKTKRFLSSEIQKRKNIRKLTRIRIAVSCASFIFLMVTGGFIYNLYYIASAYIDIDVNPYIELTLNYYNRVIDAKPHNSDAAVILQNADVNHKTYNQAVEILLDNMIKHGHLKQDALLSATVQASNSNMEKELLEGLQNTVSGLLTSRHSTAETNFFVVTQDIRYNAHCYNISPAKYIAISELQEIDPSATFESCAEHSISEIRHYFTEGHICNHHGNESPDTTHEHGIGHVCNDH